jgi:predicted nucleic acid-binding Zn ribbon protein
MKKRCKENLRITYKLIMILISLMMVVYLMLKK